MRELAATNCQPLIRTTEEAVMELTQSYLKSILHYDPETGNFTWAITRGKAKAGAIAGKVDTHGYRQIPVLRKHYFAHRLAFLYTNGLIPQSQIDHINGRRLDNTWSNLREATKYENQQNKRLYKNNKTGCPGVFMAKKSSRFYAYIRHKGEQVHLLYTGDFFEACCARKSAERLYNYHQNHGRTQ